MVRSMEQSAVAIKDPNALLLDCIDRGLKAHCAGLPQIVYWRFEQLQNFPKDEIPNRLEEFMDVLDSVFGQGGAPVKRSILREIRSSSDLQEADKIAIP
jgi:hypothetical protein